MRSGEGIRRALPLLTVLVSAPRLAAQEEVQELAARCAAGDAALVAICREGALALQAAQAGAALLAAGGTQLPGAASTLGRRFGGTPRISASVRGAFLDADIPDIRGGSPPLAGRALRGLTTQATLALGLLDGFSLIPTVGGVLSLDVLAAAGVVLLPSGPGFRDDPTFWGLGANLGLLRESFTMPGVSVSAAWRHLGELRLGERAAGDAIEVLSSPAVFSVRAVLGKDLLALGVVAGLGWDRYGSDATLVVPGPGGAARQASADGLSTARMLGFGGVSLSLLVLQLSAEAGWAQGFDAVPGRASGGYDPESGALFLSAAGRLTL